MAIRNGTPIFSFFLEYVASLIFEKMGQSTRTRVFRSKGERVPQALRFASIGEDPWD